MQDEDMIRVAEDDPTRCQELAGNGQCIHRSIEGTDRCPMHTRTTAVALKRQAAMQYNVTRWKSRIDHFSGHESVKSLREEVGVLRLLMETTLNKCETDMDLILYSNHLSGMALKIKEAVMACHKLESAMGMLLDRAAVMALTGEMVDIIGKYVKDESVISNIIRDINESLVKVESAHLKQEEL